jgi:hypothetical protein
MKNPRPESTPRDPAPLRPAEARGAKSPIMGRSNPEQKLAKFKKSKNRKPPLRPAHLPQTAQDRSPKPKAAIKSALTPIPKPASLKPRGAETAKSLTALIAEQQRTSSSQRGLGQGGSGQSGSGQKSLSQKSSKQKSSGQKSSQRRQAARSSFPLEKRVRRWIDDTKLALESPHPNTLEQLSARGTWTDAFGYVCLSAFLTALLVFRTGWHGMLAMFVLTILAYAVFVVVTYIAALRQDGDGQLEGIAYATALFWSVVAPFTALVPFIFGGAWIPAAILVQAFTASTYALRVLNGTVWMNYNAQWNAMTAGIAAASASVLLISFTLFAPLLRG